MGRKKKTKPHFEIVGETDDGIKIVRGAFRFVSEKGIDLETIVWSLKEHGMMPDWIHFLKNATKHNWKLDRTINKLEFIIRDTYGEEFVVGWRERLNAAL